MPNPSSRWADVYLATGARAVSYCGDLLAATALVLGLQQRGEGGFAVAAILIAAAVPPVVLVRWAGRIADGVDSRLLLVMTGLAQAGVCSVLAFASGAVEIIVLVGVLSVGLALTRPCLSALLPSMVTPDDLPRATALGQTATSIGTMLAPVLGGVLMGRFGLRVPLLADAASYLALAGTGALIRTRRNRRTIAPGQAAMTQAAGWRMRDDPLVWPAVVLAGTVVTAASLVNVAGVFLVRMTLHSTAAAYGSLESVWIVAATAGAWLFARRRLTDAAMGVVMLGALASTCLGVALMAAVPSVGWLVPANLVGGLGNGALNLATGVLVSRRPPPEVRGHAFAVLGAVANTAGTAGFLLGGFLLTWVPVRAAIAMAGLAGLLITAVFATPVLRAAASQRTNQQPATSPANGTGDQGS